MRKIILLSLVFLTSFTAFGQDFSNKGKEFWLCFPTHVPSSNNATLSIYITGDKASSGTITMPNGAFSANFNIAANGIQEIPIAWATNRHINGATESNTVLNKSIHIKTNTGQPPVVAYAQQWAGARSTATLLLPVNVLGTKYYSMNFAQDAGGRSQFQIIATKPNTVVEITPVKDGVKEATITINLPLEGDLYQYWSTTGNQDLTGTFIESVASGSGGCKPIAVSSGSSNIRIGTAVPNCTGGSADPLWQQLYPVATWGKNFGLIPFQDYWNPPTNTRGNPYRVMASEDNTNVYFDGVLVATLNAGQIYPAAFSGSPVTLSNPTSITADKPICVAQYAQSDACTGQTGPAGNRVGDPDMVILNPIEQNIADITVFSSTNQNITRQYANVLMKTIAIPSFRISRNGGPLNPPSGTWQTFTSLPGYSYLRESLIGANSIRIVSDSGFNAIAYGWGNVESYAYSAGTNVRDLYQQIGVQTEYGIETTPSVCTNSPFRFKVSLPYCADSIRWDLSALPGPPNPAIDTIRYNTCVPTYPLPGGPDSTTVVNGVTLYWYSLPSMYTFSTIGTYPVSMITYSPNASGCGSEQLIDFDLQISDPPTGSFNAVTPGCYLEPVVATETTPQSPKITYRQWWEFFDPVTNVTTVYTNAPPYPPNSPAPIRAQSHTFTTPGAKRIRHASITTPGCLSDTIVHFVTLPDIPNATIAGNITACINTGTVPVTFNGTLGTAEYIFSYTIDNGSGPGPVLTTTASLGGAFTINAPTNVAGTFIYNLVGVRNELPAGTPCTRAITGQSVTVTILPDHDINLGTGNPDPAVCINNAITPFTLTISGGATGILPAVGLPPGVTATLAGTTVTILGTPTVAGSYPYSITTTGNACLTDNFTGTITVNPDHSISLGGGDPNPIVCINNAIIPFTLTLADGATGIAAPVGLPAGVTATTAGNTVTILGTPTVAGTFNYTITTTGNTCLTDNFTGTIIVNPDHTIGFNGGVPNPTLCVNTIMPSFTLVIGGGASGITSAGLPPGVTATLGAGGIVTISGTPSSAIGSPFIYTITTTGNACLTASYTNTITVTDDATITHISGSTSQAVCRNTPIGAIDYLIGGSATGATISWTPSAPAGITFTPTSATTFQIAGTPTNVGTTTYNYTITTTGPCVNPPITGSITVNALPVASFTASPVRCANQDIVFTNTSAPNAANATYDWTFNDPNATAGNPNTITTTTAAPNTTHFYLVPNNYIVTMIATNSNGCISDPIASIPITVNDTPVADFNVPEVCINDVATVFADLSQPAASLGAPWYWNFGDPGSGPLNTSTAQNGSHLYPMPAIYRVYHGVTISATGCVDTVWHDITINSADPVSNFTVNNSCSIDSVALTNLSTVGFGSVTKLDIYWDNVGAPGVFETINTPAFNAVYRHKYPTLQTTQNYTVRLVAYSGNVCFTSTTRIVTVYATPIVQFNNIPNTCYLVAPFQLTQGSEIGGVPGTGTYSGPGITNPNGTFSPQVAGIGTHTIRYTWTASNPGACIDTLDRTITVLDTAHAKFAVTLPSCEQTATLFTNQSTTPASVNLASTVWDFGDATGPWTFAIATPVTHTYANPGPYTVRMHTVSITPPTPGCLSTDTITTINIDANHDIQWDAASGNENQPLCVNTSIVSIRYTLSGGATNVNFVPALPAGLSSVVSGSPLTVTISGAPTVPGNYTFDIETSGNTCVKDRSTITISVAPDHAIALRAGSDTAQSVCLNTPIDDIYYDLSGGATGVNISGLPTGVTYTVTGNELRIYGTPTAIPAIPDYNITTIGNSCLNATKIGKIFVHPYAVPTFTVDKPSYCIPNAIVAFTNTTVPLSSNLYKWNFGDGSTEVFSTDASHWYTSGVGPFTVRLTATTIPSPVLSNGQPGCASFTDVPMTSIHPQPKADFVFSKPAVCIGDNVTITDNTDGRDGIVNQWHWDLGDGTTRVVNPVTYTYGDTITYDITMYSVNTHGCNSDTITKPFTVYPYPKVNAGPDKFVLEGGSVELESSSFAREPQYTWTPDLYLTDARIARPRVMNPKTDMTYRLTVTGKGGCATSDVVFVKLLKFPAIPNTFSPNNDGINDTWRIDFLNTYPENRVQIFTRTGKIVFESRGYNTPWDGTIKGKPLPFDTYYYIIEPGNGRDPITGYVTILK